MRPPSRARTCNRSETTDAGRQDREKHRRTPHLHARSHGRMCHTNKRCHPDPSARALIKQLPRRHAVSHAAPSTALEHTIPSRSLFPSCPCTPTLLDPCSPRRTLAHSFRHILARSAPTYSTLACSTSRSLTASWLAGARWPPSAISQHSLVCCHIRLLSRSIWVPYPSDMSDISRYLE